MCYPYLRDQPPCISSTSIHHKRSATPQIVVHHRAESLEVLLQILFLQNYGVVHRLACGVSTQIVFFVSLDLSKTRSVFLEKLMPSSTHVAIRGFYGLDGYRMTVRVTGTVLEVNVELLAILSYYSNVKNLYLKLSINFA